MFISCYCLFCKGWNCHDWGFLFHLDTIGHLGIISFMPLTSWRDCIYSGGFLSQRSDGDPHILISLPIQPYIRSGLSQFSWKHQDTTFPPAHPEPYLLFPSLSRLKRMGAGPVMFTIHADTSMKSEGGPGSVWSKRLWCLLAIYFSPGALAYHIGLELLLGQLHQLSQPWWTVMFTNTSRSHELICHRHEWQPVFHYHKTDSPVVKTLIWKNLQLFYHCFPLLSWRRISQGPNADLFNDETRFIQVQSSDVAAMSIFVHNGRSGQRHQTGTVLLTHRNNYVFVIRWKWKKMNLNSILRKGPVTQVIPS